MHRLLTLLLASLLSACLYIPVKQTKVTGGSAPTADDLAFLSTPGLRFADLEAKLGMPEINFLDIGVVVYSWQMRAGFRVWGVASAGGGGGGGAGSVDQTHDLLIAYDADGRVLAHAVEKRRLVGQDAYEHASRARKCACDSPAACGTATTTGVAAPECTRVARPHARRPCLIDNPSTRSSIAPGRARRNESEQQLGRDPCARA